MSDIDRLRAAFPNADEVCLSEADYGFNKGIAVQFGKQRHAVKWDGALDDAIATLKRISRR